MGLRKEEDATGTIQEQLADITLRGASHTLLGADQGGIRAHLLQKHDPGAPAQQGCPKKQPLLGMTFFRTLYLALCPLDRKGTPGAGGGDENIL